MEVEFPTSHTQYILNIQSFPFVIHILSVLIAATLGYNDFTGEGDIQSCQ